MGPEKQRFTSDLGRRFKSFAEHEGSMFSVLFCDGLITVSWDSTAVLIKTHKTFATEKTMAQIMLKCQEETAELMTDTLAWSYPHLRSSNASLDKKNLEYLYVYSRGDLSLKIGCSSNSSSHRYRSVFICHSLIYALFHNVYLKHFMHFTVFGFVLDHF
jgi:hypothetical protein